MFGYIVAFALVGLYYGGFNSTQIDWTAMIHT